MVAAVLLRFDDLSGVAMARVVQVNALLKHNFNPEEPRDSDGRWTTEGEGDTASPAIGDGISEPRLGSCDGTSEQSNTLPISARTVSGLASWYNGVGHRMANGKPFDSDAMTAAMRTVPLGTIVTVCLAEDYSRCITVTVTDRGPYVAGRVIDLTKAAFEALVGSIAPGLVNVVVTLPDQTPQ